MDFNKRESVFEELKNYCYSAGENDFIEVTKWANEEGVDINISSSLGNRLIQLTYGELDLINILVKIKEN